MGHISTFFFKKVLRINARPSQYLQMNCSFLPLHWYDVNSPCRKCSFNVAKSNKLFISSWSVMNGCVSMFSCSSWWFSSGEQLRAPVWTACICADVVIGCWLCVLWAGPGTQGSTGSAAATVVRRRTRRRTWRRSWTTRRPVLVWKRAAAPKTVTSLTGSVSDWPQPSNAPCHRQHPSFLTYYF